MFCVLNPRNSGVITLEVCKMFVYRHTETMEYFKNQPNF